MGRGDDDEIRAGLRVLYNLYNLRDVRAVLEGDAGQAQRNGSALAQQGLQLGCVFGRPGDEDARALHARFDAGSPKAWLRAASSSGAPPLARSASPTDRPSDSGSDPRASARTTAMPSLPSGPPRAARSQSSSPASTACAATGTVQPPDSRESTARSARTQREVAGSSKGEAALFPGDPPSTSI